MKKIRIFLFLALLFTSLACLAVERAFSPEATRAPSPTTRPAAQPSRTPRPSPSPAPESACLNGDCITACLAHMDSILNQATSNTIRRKFNAEEKAITLATYSIDGDKITQPDFPSVPNRLKSLQKNTTGQQNVWNYFAAIIPPEQRRFLSHYIVYTDGKDEELAAVIQSEDDPYRWDLMVDLADASNPQDLTFTLVHEFGHLLTLNSTQIEPNLAVFKHPDDVEIYNKESAACSDYFTFEGCAKDNAYLNLFVYKFWNDIFDEWSKIDAETNDDQYYQQLDDFYNRYQDQFVTDYAVTSPEEDIAETFSYFILEPRPAGATIAERKILFFYDFPELIKLRQQIAEGLCSQTK